MTVALVLGGVRYRCDVWSCSCALEVGDIVYARFIGFKEDYPNIYDVDIQTRYKRTILEPLCHNLQHVCIQHGPQQTFTPKP